MSQFEQKQAQALEEAIMTRARELVQALEEKIKRQHDTILRDAAERLHLAEEREVLISKAEADRHFRRLTQAGELKMQGRLDQLRWEMVQSVQTRLTESMQTFREDRPAYRAWLVKMVAEADAALPAGDLIAELNADDLSWLAPQWPKLSMEAAPQRNITLASKPTWGSGGIKLRTSDNRAQLDNTFEGRLSRRESNIQRAILNRLFPTDINASARSGGPQ
jgi:V/A-type H+-transporting ATPase subunit E